MSTQQPAAQTFTLANKADLLAYIGAIARNGVQLDRMIQIAAVHAIGHAIQFGDIVYANRLYGAMPKGGRLQAMVKYFEKYGPFVYVASAKQFAHYKRDSLKFDGAALMKAPWYEIETEKVVSTLDVQKMVDSLIKRLETAIEKDGRTVQNAAMLDDIKAVSLDYAARQYVDASSFDWSVPPAPEEEGNEQQ